jgi:N-acyl-D-aspartate/D-glutamate deacylase
VGFAPCRTEDRNWLINVMEGVEDIPGAALHEGIRWDWESFPEYLNALERLPLALDVGAQVPHAALRGFVLGTQASEQQRATPGQIADMRALLAEALRAGALGFSTSRTSLHKTAEGAYVAGTFAERDELFGVCEALRDTGTGVFQVADEHLRVPQDIAWLEKLANHIRRPVCVNLSQTDFSPKTWEKGLAELLAARERGAPLFAQAAGRAIGIVMGWRGTAHPFALHPTWKRFAARPWPEVVGALRDPEVKARMLAEKPEGGNVFEQYVTQLFAKMYPLDAGYEPAPDQSLAALARARGQDPRELAYELLMNGGDGEGFLYFPLFNYSDGDLEVLRRLHTSPGVLMGLSDGGAHCGAICDAGMPTFMITHWTRDRSRGPRLPLERMVQRQTADTARFFGLHDRGVLAPGFRADVNVIDYDRLGFERPEMVWDLPAGGRRLVQRARGYLATLKSGRVIAEHGEWTGDLPGRLVRGEQAAPTR